MPCAPRYVSLGALSSAPLLGTLPVSSLPLSTLSRTPAHLARHENSGVATRPLSPTLHTNTVGGSRRRASEKSSLVLESC